MAKSRPRTCKRCGKRPQNALGVSFNGLCRPCGEKAEAENARQVATGEGEYAERRREGIRRYLASLEQN